jgi:hypothetical protein
MNGRSGVEAVSGHSAIGMDGSPQRVAEDVADEKDALQDAMFLQRAHWCASLGPDADAVHVDSGGVVGVAAPPRAPEDAAFATCEQLVSFLKDFLRCKPRKLFIKYTMHEAVSESTFRRYVREITQAAIRVAAVSEGGAVPQVVVFADELVRMASEHLHLHAFPIIWFLPRLSPPPMFTQNTAPTNVIAMLKECMIDGTFDGIELPKNIFWAGAVNPAGTATDSRQTQFVVREMPRSLHQLVLDYTTLSEKQEEEFLATFVADVGVDLGAAAHSNIDVQLFQRRLVRLALLAQRFVRSLSLDRVHVSIRDLMRTLKLYQTLIKHRAALLPFASASEVPHAGAQADDHWCALIIAVGLAYQLRLPQDARFALADKVDAALAELRCPTRFRMQPVLDGAVSKVYDATAVPCGISRTSALMENIYACVTTLLAGIPLSITGPPGCGKTLAVQTVVDNMKAESAAAPMYKQLRNLQQMPYQCSESSTASEIASVFDSAIARSREMKRSKCETIVLVFLDVSLRIQLYLTIESLPPSIFLLPYRKLVFQTSAERH